MRSYSEYTFVFVKFQCFCHEFAYPSGIVYNPQQEMFGGCFMATEWLTVEYIANELKVSEGTVRGWIRDRKLKGAKFGRDYRIRREDYEKFIHEHLNPDDEREKK